jgi:outer membrane protein assembly factor BamE
MRAIILIPNNMSTQPKLSLRQAMRESPMFRFIALAALAAFLSGCVYRMNIQQGNFLEAGKVEQLQVGMTRSQVRFLLGTPMVPDAFDNDRWDYLYYMKRGRLQKPEQRHLTVFFEEDKVARIDRHGDAPAAAESSQAEPAPPKSAS